MASPSRITAPMRHHPALAVRCATRLCPSLARTITTSTPTRASVADATPVKPLSEQTVLATIHRFPSLEPLRFQAYPANHLYLPTRRDILHRAVIYEGDKTRLGTASTKTRYEVHGSRRKIRPQKGSGRARLGDKKSPMLRGGGVAFGPKFRDFSTGLQTKVYDLAWRTALSYRFRKGELIIVDNPMEIESPSTRLLEDIFRYHDKLRGKGRSLLVTLEQRPLLGRALADMDRAEQAMTWDNVDVKQLLELSRVIIEREALHNILLSHQEDITHRSMPPWHKGLIRSSPPRHLESTVGWSEFRTLALSNPTEKQNVHPYLYETVATTRYNQAETLAQGPQRTELTVSSYNLLAEAKQLQFTQCTGLPFQEYTRLQESNTEEEEISSLYPRIQALDYQISVQSDHATSAAETSQLQSEITTITVRNLEVQKAEIVSQAALLAAQIHEHTAEAHNLMGADEAGQSALEKAGEERTNVDLADLQVLEAKVQLAKQESLVAGLKGSEQAKAKAQKEVERWTELAEAKRRQNEGWDELIESEEENVEAVAPGELEQVRVPDQEAIEVKGEVKR